MRLSPPPANRPSRRSGRATRSKPTAPPKKVVRAPASAPPSPSCVRSPPKPRAHGAAVARDDGRGLEHHRLVVRIGEARDRREGLLDARRIRAARARRKRRGDRTARRRAAADRVEDAGDAAREVHQVLVGEPERRRVDRRRAVAGDGERIGAVHGRAGERVEGEVVVAGEEVDGVVGADEIDRAGDVRAGEQVERVGTAAEQDGGVAEIAEGAPVVTPELTATALPPKNDCTVKPPVLCPELIPVALPPLASTKNPPALLPELVPVAFPLF